MTIFKAQKKTSDCSRQSEVLVINFKSILTGKGAKFNVQL